MFDFIVFIFFVVSIVLLSIDNARLKVKYASLVRKTLESHLAHNLALEKATSEADIDKEAFIKFLSQSRDSAFQYIEDVQLEVKKFIDTVEPDINHFDRYGEGFWSPLTPTMKKISESIKELKKVLPKDSNA